VPGGLVRAALIGLLLGNAGCVTQGDFLRLREEVALHHQAGRDDPDPFDRIAQLSAEVDSLREQVAALEGELELARKDAGDALEEVRRTRLAIAQGGVNPAAAGAVLDGVAGAGADGSAATGAAGASGGSGAVAAMAAGNAPTAEGSSAAAPAPTPLDQELAGYQGALDAWRSDDLDACIEQFTAFLQSYPTSGYADDAAYWLADCTYKKQDFKRAVVRFNAVVSVYPQSPKAPDALYRQGESLLKLGPKFHEAARTVFKRVEKDYPDSERALEAAQQLERLGSSG
jgi:tol-pal system protein YbgF